MMLHSYQSKKELDSETIYRQGVKIMRVGYTSRMPNQWLSQLTWGGKSVKDF
jgi:hypothetical protein